jgi:hypothetical protein
VRGWGGIAARRNININSNIINNSNGGSSSTRLLCAEDSSETIGHGENSTSLRGIRQKCKGVPVFICTLRDRLILHNLDELCGGGGGGNSFSGRQHRLRALNDPFAYISKIHNSMLVIIMPALFPSPRHRVRSSTLADRQTPTPWRQRAAGLKFGTEEDLCTLCSAPAPSSHSTVTAVPSRITSHNSCQAKPPAVELLQKTYRKRGKGKLTTQWSRFFDHPIHPSARDRDQAYLAS